MTKYRSRFGGFTLRTRKEHRETSEENEWAARSGEVTVSHISTHEENPQFSENQDPYTEPEKDISCEE